MFNKSKVQLNKYLKLKYLLNDESIEKKISIENIKAYWKNTNSTDIDKLLQWSEQNKQYIDIDEIGKLERKVTLSVVIIILIMFIIGLLMGFGLLSHDNTSRVNVTWFLFIMILFPFALSIFSFFYSMILLYNKNNSTKNIFTKILEEIIFKPVSKLILNPSIIMPYDLVKNLLLVRLQQGSLALLTGTIFALFMTLLAKYVIFGWESTVIDTSSLQNFINFIAFPWIFCCPNAVPSLEVIQDSHYYLSNNIVDLETLKSDTALSGSWWKFLGMSLIIYGFIPRFILLYLSNKIYHNALINNILDDKNANEILLSIDKANNITTTELRNEEQIKEVHNSTPINSNITTTELRNEEQIKEVHNSTPINSNITTTELRNEEQIKEVYNSTPINSNISKKIIKNSFDYMIGWSHTKEILELILKHKNMTASHIEIAGGNVPIDKEDELISLIEGSVIIFVDSWEPPQKDFINFVSSILKNTKNNILIYPVGMPDDNYEPEGKNISIWKNKIKTINSSNIGIYNA